MTNRKQIAILGGSFDPITVGHVKLAQFVLDSKISDEVWITPCFQHIYGKKMADAQDRIKMCELAVADNPKLKVFTYEIDNRLEGSTYGFVKRLLQEPFAENHNFSIVIGMDNANTFNKWVNYKLLAKMVRFVVLARKGVERNPKNSWYLKLPHMFLNQNSTPEVSSTQVRSLIKENNSAKEFLNPDVLKYIIDKKLYR